MLIFGEVDGLVILELKWVFYIIEIFKDVLNGCFWVYRESILNIGKDWNSFSGLVNKIKNNEESLFLEILKVLNNIVLYIIVSLVLKL